MINLIKGLSLGLFIITLAGSAILFIKKVFSFTNVVARKYLSAFLFILIIYSIIPFIHSLFPAINDDLSSFIRLIPRCMGGTSAVYYIFMARSLFSRNFCLFSLLISNLFIFYEFFDIDIYNIRNINIEIFMLSIIIIISYILSFCFVSKENIQIDRNMNFFFIFLIFLRIPISPEMGLSLIIENIFLFFLNFYFNKKIRNWEIFISTVLLFFFILFFLPNLFFKIHMLSILALATSTALYFFCLSKNTFEQNFAFIIYFIDHIYFGIVQNKGESFHNGTIVFFFFFFLCFVSYILISLIKENELSQVIFESKNSLRAIYFSLLIIVHLSFTPDFIVLNVGIPFLVIKITLLILLTFILKEEDKENKG